VSRRTLPCLTALLGLLAGGHAAAFELEGQAVQGGLVFGKAAPGSTVTLDDRRILVSAEGRFLFGFGRDDTGSVSLEVREPGKEPVRRTLDIAPREYNIERVDGLPPATVTPPPEVLERPWWRRPAHAGTIGRTGPRASPGPPRDG
jgi:hypothetical protein